MRSEIPDRDGPDAAPEAAERVEPSEVTADQPDGAGDSEPRDGGSEANAGELDALRDKYLRLAAEFENFRRRTDRERQENRDRAQGQLLEKLLEPLDDLQRVAQYSSEGTTTQTLLEGVQMVERKLTRVLEAAGLEVVEARGEAFDPELHEALMMTPTAEEGEDHTVGEVFQRGYRFRGSLLRPARVQVRRFEG